MALDEIIAKVTAAKASNSGTIYLTSDNLELVCRALRKHHGRKLTESHLSELIFQEYVKRSDVDRETFMRTYRVVFHSWGLYYFEDGRFYFTKMLIDYINGDCNYSDIIETICVKWQYPKPQQQTQPSGPLRPMVALLKVMNSLKKSELSSRLTHAECNLFVMFISSDNEIEEFIDLLVEYRKDDEYINAELKKRSIEIKTNGLESGIERMIWYLKKANAISDRDGIIEVL